MGGVGQKVSWGVGEEEGQKGSWVRGRGEGPRGIEKKLGLRERGDRKVARRDERERQHRNVAGQEGNCEFCHGSFSSTLIF